MTIGTGIFSSTGARRVQLDMVPSLTKIFGVSCDELLGIKPLPPPPSDVVPERLRRHMGTLKRLSVADQRFIIQLAETMMLPR